MSDAAGLPYGHGGDIWTQRERKVSEAVLDLSANTNPLGMSPAAARAARDAVETSDRYPDPRCRRLAFAIAKAGTDPGWVLCGNGAADLIWRLCLAEAPRRVLVAAPTFSGICRRRPRRRR